MDLKINDVEKIFVYLNIIYKISTEGKIIPNQNMEFCYLADLKIEKVNDTSIKEKINDNSIPEELKDIAKDLENDVRIFLIHSKVEKLNNLDIEIDTYGYRDICEEIDDRIKEKYSDSKNHTDSKFKKVVRNLIEIYFERIDNEEHLNKYFPYTFSLKEKIIFDVIYNKEYRKNIFELGKMCGEDCFSKLIENNDLVNMIMKETPQNIERLKELCKKFPIEKFFEIMNNSNLLINPNIKYNDFFNMLMNETSQNIEKLKELFSKYKVDEIYEIMKNLNSSLTNKNNKSMITHEEVHHSSSYSEPIIIKSNETDKSISVAFNSSITETERIYYEDTFNDFMRYYDDFDINKKTGYSGEAYIYELLCQSNLFKRVKWEMLIEDGRGGQPFEYNGKIYHINPSDRSHHDILAETEDGREFYFEVKSTRHEYSNNKVPIYLSRMQIDSMKNVSFPNEYILAVVFDVMSACPKHFFMTLRENILSNCNYNNEAYELIIDLENQFGEKRITELFKSNEIKNILEGNLQNKQ